MGRKKTKDKLVEKGESSTTRPTRLLISMQQTESQNAVFCNPLLMDKIVKYSIYKSDGKEINTQAVVGIRLVNKTWLQTASRLFKKSGDWTIILALVNKDGRLNDGSRISKTEKHLDQFVSVFSKSSRSTDSILPVLFLSEELYLKKGTCKTIKNLFEQCSDIISVLYMINPLEEVSVYFNNTCFDFPILHTFQFLFKPDDEYESEDNTFQNKANGLKLVRNILLRARNLKDFWLVNREEEVLNSSSLVLPATLKSLKFHDLITQEGLTLLTKRTLPNLNCLDLNISEEDEVPLLYKILENFQNQLTSLFIKFTSNRKEEDEELCICIKFPVLEKLTTLTFSGKEIDFNPELQQACLPNLRCLVFKDLPESVFLDFVQGFKFENLNTLKISLTELMGHFPITQNPDVEIMEQLISSFPNVQELTLTINLEDTSGLTYLFENFTTLQKLQLDFDLTTYLYFDKSIGYETVSLFLGISLDLAKAIVKKPEKNPSVPVDNPKSIMNLKRLNSLTLSTMKSTPKGLSAKNLFFTDVISKHGLEKMPQLQEIKLLGLFEIEQ